MAVELVPRRSWLPEAGSLRSLAQSPIEFKLLVALLVLVDLLALVATAVLESFVREPLKLSLVRATP